MNADLGRFDFPWSPNQINKVPNPSVHLPTISSYLTFTSDLLCFLFHCFSVWNSLPLEIQLQPKTSMPLFHKLLKSDPYHRSWTWSPPPELVCWGALYKSNEWMNADFIFLDLQIKSIKFLTHPSTYPPTRHLSLSPLICCAVSFIVFISGIHSPWRYNCCQRPV